MNVLLTAQSLQGITWLAGLLAFILVFYMLLLNSRHTVNRHISLLMFWLAIYAFALGELIGAVNIDQTRTSMCLLAMMAGSLPVGILLASIALLTPQWMHGRQRWIVWLLYVLQVLPILLTASDVLGKTQLWYSPYTDPHYAGGYVPPLYIQGNVANVLWPFYQYGVPALTLLFIVSTWLQRQATSVTRRHSGALAGGLSVAYLLYFALPSTMLPGASATASIVVIIATYTYFAFRQMTIEQRMQRGRLHSRLVGLTLIVALPILVGVLAFVLIQSLEVMEGQAFEKLEATNKLVAANVQLWLDFNSRALQQLVALPQIRSMDPEEQRPVLQVMESVYPYIYLVSTTDLKGMNVARSDDAPLTDYSDREWFRMARLDVVVHEVVIGRTSGQPALVMATPIRGQGPLPIGALPVGVGMFATTLEQMSRDIAATRFGESGIVYVVDAQDRIVMHPDAAVTSQILNIHDSPIIQKMRVDKEQEFNFVDADGVRWQVYAQVLPNGWGVIVQQEWDELHRPLLDVGETGAVVAIAGATLLGALMFFTMRQAFLPIDALTVTATAIAEGDLTRTAPVMSEDELGVLARTFNSMTAQLRESIDTLEQRVASRTLDLERHSAYLAASAEVSHAAVSILDPDILIHQVVDLIRERFDLYYVGLFLVDETKTWAVLRSGTGAAGAAMLARQHRIRVGEGMIGWSIANAETRIASHAELDEVRLVNPELPETRSEAALPLRSRGQVLGALTVQSSHPDAFDPESVAVLQTMVDQVAVAIDNARLLAQAQAALESERRAYGIVSRQDWNRLARARVESGYAGVRQAAATQEVAVLVAQGEWSPEMRTAQRTQQSVSGQQNGMPTLAVPIVVRDQVVGVLNFSKSAEAGGLAPGATWTREEITLLEALAGQLGQALDVARLYRQTVLRAAREGAIREISDQMQRATDMTALMRITAEALNRTLGGSRVYVHLGVAAGTDAPPAAVEQTDGGDHGDTK
ncbi:MAG TPA: GAF domain-containing protein [Anaerolineae bacterium]|nr:GAF domain-containing protein [Anaerolineae bacterium]HQH37073.1 GAF domain-containing protein [Anaerolineae bacterium]